MPLLAYTDLELQKNITLADPKGQDLAERLIASVLAWSARHCNRLGWEKTTYTEYFSPDDDQDLFYLSALPLDIGASVTVSTYNDAIGSYDAYPGTVRKRDNGAVKTADCLSPGYEAVKIAYTGGYTDDAFPDDLKQALVELVAQKFGDAQSGGKVVTEVRAIDYVEKYELSTADIPADILEVVDSYKLPVIA